MVFKLNDLSFNYLAFLLNVTNGNFQHFNVNITNIAIATITVIIIVITIKGLASFCFKNILHVIIFSILIDIVITIEVITIAIIITIAIMSINPLSKISLFMLGIHSENSNNSNFNCSYKIYSKVDSSV